MKLSASIFLIFGIGAANGQANVPIRQATMSSDIVDGTRINQFQERLKSVFPQASSIKEVPVLPLESGGSSLMGLVSRLLGEPVNRDYEGLKTRRFIYKAFEGDKPIGLAHGSSFDVNNTRTDVIVFYDQNGFIKEIYYENLPDHVRADLDKGGFLKQFIGRSSLDFEVTLGRRGRIKSRGPFWHQARRPGGITLRTWFEKITRSVRFNSAFMEVAYFITQHPAEDFAPQVILKAPFESASAAPTPQAPPMISATAAQQAKAGKEGPEASPKALASP